MASSFIRGKLEGFAGRGQIGEGLGGRRGSEGMRAAKDAGTDLGTRVVGIVSVEGELVESVDENGERDGVAEGDAQGVGGEGELQSCGGACGRVADGCGW